MPRGMRRTTGAPHRCPGRRPCWGSTDSDQSRTMSGAACFREVKGPGAHSPPRAYGRLHSRVHARSITAPGVPWSRHGSPRRWAERAASGRRPSEPDPGNAGAGMVARNRPPDEQEIGGRACPTKRKADSDATTSSCRCASARDGRRSARRGGRGRRGDRAGLRVAGGPARAARSGAGARRPGAGASGVAAGMLAPGGRGDLGRGRADCGSRSPRRAPGRRSPRSSRPTAGSSPATSPAARCTSRSTATRRRSCERRFELMDRSTSGSSGSAPAPRASWSRASRRPRGGVHAPGEARPIRAPLSQPSWSARGLRRRVGDRSDVTEPIMDGVPASPGYGPPTARSTAPTTSCWRRALGRALGRPGRARPPVRPVKGQVLTLAGPPDDPIFLADGRLGAGLHGAAPRRAARPRAAPGKRARRRTIRKQTPVRPAGRRG